MRSVIPRLRPTLISGSCPCRTLRHLRKTRCISSRLAPRVAAGGWRQKITGLATGSLSLTINQDFAAAAGDALFGLGGTVGFNPGQSTPYYIDIRPTSAARGSTNPSYVAAWVSTSYQPVNGSVGELAVITLTMPMTGRPARLTS